MDKTEGFAPQLARQGKHHAPAGSSSLVAKRHTSRAFDAYHFGVYRNDKLQFTDFPHKNARRTADRSFP